MRDVLALLTMVTGVMLSSAHTPDGAALEEVGALRDGDVATAEPDASSDEAAQETVAALARRPRHALHALDVPPRVLGGILRM